jgi:hypothetical protein
MYLFFSPINQFKGRRSTVSIIAGVDGLMARDEAEVEDWDKLHPPLYMTVNYQLYIKSDFL